MPDSILSDSQLHTLALIKRRRRAGLLPTAEEIDFIIDLINQHITPGHTCVDRENLPCIACEGADCKGGAA
jgi:hypothetical protein